MYSRYITDRAYREDIPERVIFVDTETHETKVNDATSKLELLLGCYEVWVVDPDGLPIGMMDHGVFTTELEFYTLLQHHAPCRVVAHNWRFDATVLRVGARDNLARYGYDIDVSNSIIPVQSKGFTPFSISLDFNGRLVQLLCNTNYYKQSLDSLGQSFGNPKTDIPMERDYEDDAEYIDALADYCMNDVVVLRKAYLFLFQFTSELGNTTPSITIAMSANRVYRNAFLPPDLRIQGTLGIPYISDIEQGAYKGGRTDAFYRGNPDTEIYKYDVNSLYPYSMLGDIPIRYVQGVPESMAIDTLDGKPARYIYLMDVCIEIKESDDHAFIGGEGLRTDKGDLIFPIGKYRIWCWQPMVKTLYDRGYIKHIHRAFGYNKASIFDDYVLTLYKLREEYKQSGDKSRDLLVKILLNSLYGKFGQREYSSWEVADAYETEIVQRDAQGIERFNEVYDGVETEYLQVTDTIYKAYADNKGNPSKNAVTSIAGYITTVARSILWETMAMVLESGGNIYYCDTDSIFTDIRLPDNMVSPTELGKWALEETIPRGKAEFVSPKHYRVGDKWTIKGIRKPSDNATHDQTIFPNFITDLTSRNKARRERLESGAMLTYITKTPTGINGKRTVIGDNSPTFPLVIN